MKRFISLLLLVILLVPVVPCAQAEEAAPRSSNFFHGYGTTLSKEGNGRIKIVFSATGMGICSQIGVATYTVYKILDDGNWLNVSGLVNGSMGTNMTSYTFSHYFNGVPGESYCVQVTFFCTINNASEARPYTSGIITAR